MASGNRFAELADSIVDLLGGKENISYYTHCVTRLRFNIKDKGLVQADLVEGLSGVMGSNWAGDQFQVIIGASVADAYKEIAERNGLETADPVAEDGAPAKEGFSINKVFEAISGSITPIVPVLIAAGFVKIVVLLCEQFGLLSADNSTDVVLNFVADAGFYFLPVFVGASAAKKFGANMALGMMMGAVLIHPTFTQSVSDGTALSIFGLPIYPATYTASVIPIILIVWIMSYVERFFAKHSPEAIRTVAEPFLTILVMLPLGLCVLGPIGSFLGTYLSAAIVWLYNTTGFVGMAVLSALFPWIIMTGMHYALDPYIIESLATAGYEPFIVTANIIGNINQGVACLVVALKTKHNENLRSVASGCAVTAIVSGIVEPALYGVNVKLMKPMFGAMIGSFVGAAVAGFGHAYTYAMTGAPGLLALPIFLGGDSIDGLLWAVASMAIGAVATFAATWVLYREDAPEVREAENAEVAL